MTGLTEYLIKAAPKKWRNLAEVYEVHKFEGGQLPTGTYHVFRREDETLGCDCPAGTHHATGCKHMAWVGRWLEMPEGVYSISPEGEFTKLEGLGVEHLAALERKMEGERHDVSPRRRGRVRAGPQAPLRRPRR